LPPLFMGLKIGLTVIWYIWIKIDGILMVIQKVDGIIGVKTIEIDSYSAKH